MLYITSFFTFSFICVILSNITVLTFEGGDYMSATPTMMTIREIARTGLLSEHALRLLLKEGKLPAIYVGNKALVNYDKLCEQLHNLDPENALTPQTESQ